LNADGYVNLDAPVNEQVTHSVEFITNIRVPKQRAEAVRKLVDPAVLEALVGDRYLSVRQAAVENPACPDSALQTALRALTPGKDGVNANTVKAAIRHPNASDETLCLAARLATRLQLQPLLNREPPISFEVFLAAIVAYAAVASYVDASEFQKTTMPQRSKEFTATEWAALWAAAIPASPDEEGRGQGRHQEVVRQAKAQLREFLARCSDTPPEILESLASDQDANVRSAVARNLKTPTTLLTALATDRLPQVRSAVARNRNTPPAILEGLSSSKHEGVRRSVAENRNTPPATLERLAVDKDEGVREAVHSNRKAPATARAIAALLG
jgi:hypothetical protein